MAIITCLIYLCILLPIVNGYTQSMFDKTCNHPSDVIFMLDCSGSLRPEEFQKQLDFMKKFVSNTNVSPNVVRIGLITFSTEPRNIFHLRDFRTKREVMYAISRTRYRGGHTYTWSALDYVRRYAFSRRYGARDGVDKVLIIITDGGSNDGAKTTVAAKRIKSMPIRIYSIGIGKRVNQTELKLLATPTGSVFYVDNSNALKSIQNEVRRNVCRSVCDIWPADIVFLLDESTSIYDADYEKQRHFLASFINDSSIGPTKSRVSVITFSSRPRNQFWLRDYQSKRELLEAVTRMIRSYGDTFTSDALEMARKRSFLPRHGGRIRAMRIVIVVTDGKSTVPRETSDQARKLHNAKTTVFAIGVGPHVDKDELNAIASNPNYVFKVDNYSALASIKKKVTEKVCTLHITNVARFRSHM